MEEPESPPIAKTELRSHDLFTLVWRQYNRPNRLVTIGHVYPLAQSVAANNLLRESRSEYRTDASANPRAIERNLGWTKLIHALGQGRQWPIKRLFEMLDPMLEEGIALAVVPTHLAYQADWPTRTLARRLAQRGRVDATSCLIRTETIRRITFGGPSTREVHRRTIQVENEHLVSGRRVLLLDDIARSGASLTACRELLYEAGATVVQAMALEAKLFGEIENSKSHYSVGVSETVLTGVIASRLKLNDEQKDALRHICESGDGRIRVVSGMAGTGKTNLLSSARFAWELEGFEVYGAALAGKAAKGLSDGSRIESETIHKTLFDIESGRLRLHDKCVLVVDESGMVGTRQFEKLVEVTEKTGTRLVFVGDKKQLQPIDAGGPLSATEEKLGAASLTTIHRQREEWAKGAVHDFAAGRADEGLAAYAERGLLTVAPDRRQAYNGLISAWKVDGIRAPEDQLIFAGTRLDAANLNRLAQAARQEAGVLGSQSVSTPGGSESFHVGDQVLFTKKSRPYGVENGSLGKVVAVDENRDTLAIRVDNGERVVLRLQSFPHVHLGYAMTTHKGQGATVERAFVLAGGAMQDREITYVQTSRACGDTQIFADAETAGEGLTRLVRKMSESRQKEMAHTVQQIPQP